MREHAPGATLGVGTLRSRADAEAAVDEGADRGVANIFPAYVGGGAFLRSLLAWATRPHRGSGLRLE